MTRIRFRGVTHLKSPRFAIIHGSFCKFHLGLGWLPGGTHQSICSIGAYDLGFRLVR